MSRENSIKDNTAEGCVANNLHLKTGSVITVTGSLAGSSIGLNMQTEGAFTSGFSTYNSGVNPAFFFTPDRFGKAVSLDGNQEASMANIPSGAVSYIEHAWDANLKEVTATTKYLNEQIQFDATPTSETQYKLLSSTTAKTLNLGTGNSTLHEFYVVKGTVRVNELLLVGPNVHIVLCDDAQLVLGNSSKELGKNIFDLFDFLSADFLMLLGGLLIVIFAGWKLGRKVVYDEVTNGGKLPVPAWLLKTLLFLIRFVAPAALLAIAIFQIHE